MPTSNTVMKNKCGNSGCDSKLQCCPDCGAVECLCRPRFFAGQLLSEQDLNRLDQYIKNKNRLHNRSQHGWGVVNGLKVICDPCSEVKVTEGYAVGPCGDDIVVCEETRVNICDLIRKCKQAHPEPNCDPVRSNGNPNCADVEETWVLTIKYEEWPSRGVTALRGNTCDTASSSCSCGNGGSACSCGAASRSSAASKRNIQSVSGKTHRGSPPECEPTVICEGFSFDVYKKPVEDPKGEDEGRILSNLSGSFADSFNCCFQSLIDTIPPMPDLQDNDDVLEIARSISSWCCSWRKNLLDYFHKHPNTSCEVIEFLNRVDCPSLLRPGTFLMDFIVSFLSLFAAWAEGIKVCFCLSLLPPAPESTCDTRVPLATVRIRANDCKVLSICNWSTERKMMVTWPAMAHWLGIFNIGEFFHNLLDTFCCNSLLGIFDDILRKYPQRDPQALRAASTDLDGNPETGVGANVNVSDNADFNLSQEFSSVSGDMSSRFSLGSVNQRSENFASFIGDALSRGNEPLELGAVLNSVSPRFKLPTNGKDLSDVEASNIPLLLLSEMVVKPIANSFLGEREASKQMADLQKKYSQKNAENETRSNADVEAQLAALKTQVEEQAKQLSTFKDQLKASK